MAATEANPIGRETAAKIVALREKWHTKNHPFFVEFSEGKFGLEPVGRMMAQHYQHILHIMHSVGFAYAKAPMEGRRFILENIAEEQGLIAGPGEHSRPQVHREMIKTFCRHTGIGDDELERTEQLPAWRARSYFYVNTMLEQPFPVIVAMQSTQEGQQPGINGERMLPGLTKHHGFKIDDPAIEFFAEHYVADQEHSSRQIELVARLTTNEEMAERALKVAEIAVKTRWACMNDIYRYTVLGQRDPMPQGIAA